MGGQPLGQVGKKCGWLTGRFCGRVDFEVQLGFERGWDMVRKFPMLRFWMKSCAATVVATGVLAASVALPVVAADDKKPEDKKSEVKKGADKAAAGEKSEGDAAKAKPAARAPKIPEKVYSTGYTGSAQELIAFVNTEIRKGWEANAIAPSEVADDAEWLRRVYLDIVGHIPDSDEVVRFLGDKDKAKRAKLIDELLDTPAFVRNQTVIWTNLLIGRRTPDRVSRRGLEKFLRESFAKNKGWDKIVADLLSAEGHFEENGAANFLLAHLNDGAVPRPPSAPACSSARKCNARSVTTIRSTIGSRSSSGSSTASSSKRLGVKSRSTTKRRVAWCSTTPCLRRCRTLPPTTSSRNVTA